MVLFPLKGWVIPFRTTLDKRGPFGVHLCQKDPKSAKKQLIYGYFPTEKLQVSIENHIGQRTPWCSFVPKLSKIHQEMADLWLFSQ